MRRLSILNILEGKHVIKFRNFTMLDPTWINDIYAFHNINYIRRYFVKKIFEIITYGHVLKMMLRVLLEQNFDKYQSG